MNELYAVFKDIKLLTSELAVLAFLVGVTGIRMMFSIFDYKPNKDASK